MTPQEGLEAIKVARKRVADADNEQELREATDELNRLTDSVGNYGVAFRPRKRK